MTKYIAKDLIPHRGSMLLVDEIVDAKANEFIHTRSKFSADHRVFEGHFPGNPIMPGMLVLEMMAQAAACLSGISLDLTSENALYYFLGVDNAKFRKMLFPDEQYDVHIKAIKIRKRLCKFEGKVMRGDEVAVEASFAAMIDVKEEL